MNCIVGFGFDSGSRKLLKPKFYVEVLLMRYYCSIFFVFAVCFHLNAQLQKSYWYFGYNVGLDFSSGSPIIDTNGQVETMEGCTSISDEFGHLLFYSDGQLIYDRTHHIMQNGSNLNGHSSSTSSAVILPKPDDCNLYYVFTIDARERRQTGIEYNVVDMSANGGLGAVIEKHNKIPINGLQQGYEKLAAISNGDKNGYWILTHFESKFYAFAVTADGVSLDPVISSSEIFGGSQYIGYLKGSPDGSKVGMGMFSSANNQNAGYLSVYDFDKTTGIVSNEIILYQPTSIPGNYYGIEFSPDGTLMYATNVILGNLLKVYIEQYNLNAPVISESKYLVSLNAHYGALQLALDGKIYNSGNQESGNQYIGSILNPNMAYNPLSGEVPIYDKFNIDLNPYADEMTPSFGLPTFLNNYFRIAINVNGLAISEQQLYCSGTSLSFNFCSQGGEIQGILWDFGDGTTSSEMFPQHGYSTPGLYTIVLSLIVDGESYEKSFEIIISGPPDVHNASQNSCINEAESYEFNLEESIPEINFNNGNYTITFHETEDEAVEGVYPLPTIFTTTETTIIWVRVEDDKSCFVIKQLSLNVYFNPNLEITSPIEICIGQNAVLTVNTEDENTVYWFDDESSTVPIHIGEVYETSELFATTNFWVEIGSSDGCKSERKLIEVEVKDLVVPSFNLTQEYCFGYTPEILQNMSDNNISGTWSPSQINTNQLGTQLYTFTPDNSCAEKFYLEVFVYDTIIPEFEFQTDLCLNEDEFILPQISTNEVSGIWIPPIVNTSEVGMGYYKFIPDLECADTILKTIEIKDVVLPEFSVSQNYCMNSEASALPQISDNGILGTWFPQEIDTSIQGTIIYTFTPNIEQCSEIYNLPVTIYPQPDMEIEEEILICEGEQYTYFAPEGFDVYEWTDENGNIISQTQEVIFADEGIYQLSVQINGIPCVLSRNIVVSLSIPPYINEIKTTSNSITIHATGTNPLEYSFNKVFWQLSPTFHNLLPGIYTLYVKDAKGCATAEQRAMILGIPNIISPNGDGFNDTWTIRGLDPDSNSKFQIFDRYGKLILDRIIGSNFTWDGKYNGQSLPSGAYRYILTLKNGERISGNIQLKNY